MDQIIEHLANLKFYAAYKKSKARNFDQYLKYINSGAPKDFQWSKAQGFSVIDKYEFEDPLLGDVVDSVTEDAIEKHLEQQQQEQKAPQLNVVDWYENAEIEIKYRLKRHDAEIFKKRELFILLKELINKYELIKELISISDEDFFTYTSRMQGKAPENFMTVFSKKKKIEDYPLIDCYPRIFLNCKPYAFFQELKKEIENPAADYSFIFYQMRDDKLIHFYCKDDYHLLINKDSETPIEVYPESKVKNSKFKRKYSHIYQNMF